MFLLSVRVLRLLSRCNSKNLGNMVKLSALAEVVDGAQNTGICNVAALLLVMQYVAEGGAPFAVTCVRALILLRHSDSFKERKTPISAE